MHRTFFSAPPPSQQINPNDDPDFLEALALFRSCSLDEPENAKNTAVLKPDNLVAEDWLNPTLAHVKPPKKRKRYDVQIVQPMTDKPMMFFDFTGDITANMQSFSPLMVFAVTDNPRFTKNLPQFSHNRYSWVHLDAHAPLTVLIDAVKAMPTRTYLYLNPKLSQDTMIRLIQNMPSHTVLILDIKKLGEKCFKVIPYLPKQVELAIDNQDFSSLFLSNMSQCIPEESGVYLHCDLAEKNILPILNTLGLNRTVRPDSWMGLSKFSCVANYIKDGTHFLYPLGAPRIFIDQLKAFMPENSLFIDETTQQESPYAIGLSL